MNIIPESVHQGSIGIGGAVPRDQRWSISTLVEVAMRRIGWIALAVSLSVALAGAYLMMTPDSFTAKAVLMTDTKQSPPSPSQVSQEPLIDPAVIDSQIEILKSEHIAQQVVDKLNLAADPEFAGGPPGLRARLVAWLSGRKIAVPGPEALRASAASALLAKVKINRAGHSYLAEIAATTLDPGKSARIANAVADAYIKDQLDSRLDANQRSVAWMNDRVEDVRQQATAAAGAAARFRADHAAALAVQDPAATVEADRLAGAAASARTDFESLQTRSLRLAQFVQQQTLPVTEARVLTAATPPLSKSAPKSTVILLLAIVGGLLSGAGIAILREVLDRRLRSTAQIKAAFGLSTLGRIPIVRRRSGAVASLFDAHRPWCAATETLRSLKVTIDNDVRRTGGAVIGFVSPWPGEGKSTLAANMGRMLAEIGASVLLIDGNLKKPDLSCALAPDSERGLVDVIQGGATLERCVMHACGGLAILGHGRGEAPLHPFDVLGSRRMEDALAAARASFDYVLLDLPALLTSVDSQSVARFVDAFVLVAESGRTTIDDVDQALGTSDVIFRQIVGVVLNKARGKGGAVARRSVSLRRRVIRGPVVAR